MDQSIFELQTADQSDCVLYRVLYRVLNGMQSDQVDVTSGVPQGSVLGPLLFLIYMNDICCGISSRLRMFADDCVLYRVIHTVDDHTALQNDLDLISTWCNI